MNSPPAENSPQLEQPAILIVDDDVRNLRVLINYLNQSGYDILVARSGEAGLQQAQLGHPALILLDVVLPGLDGFEICRRLKNNPRTKDIPVIFLTALSSTESILTGFEVGGADYITKPLREQEVLVRVSTQLRLRDVTGQLEQKVRERTLKLSSLNRNLRQEIRDRKKAEDQVQQHNLHLKKAVEQKQREMEQLAKRLVHQGKLTTVEKIAGSIAHELRNPLGTIQQSIYYLHLLHEQDRLDASNPKVTEHLALIEAELKITNRVITALLETTHLTDPHLRPTDLQHFITELTQQSYNEQQLQLLFKLNPDPFLLAVDPQQFQQLISHLLTNAVQAAAPKQVTVTVYAQRQSDTGHDQLTIEDNGPGMAEGTLAQVFDPLFSTKATGPGLGLSLCKQIIENHGGSVVMFSQVGQGTRVEIVLPGEAGGLGEGRVVS